jgi:hypothetical protein
MRLTPTMATFFMYEGIVVGVGVGLTARICEEFTMCCSFVSLYIRSRRWSERNMIDMLLLLRSICYCRSDIRLPNRAMMLSEISNPANPTDTEGLLIPNCIIDHTTAFPTVSKS